MNSAFMRLGYEALNLSAITPPQWLLRVLLGIFALYNIAVTQLFSGNCYFLPRRRVLLYEVQGLFSLSDVIYC